MVTEVTYLNYAGVGYLSLVVGHRPTPLFTVLANRRAEAATASGQKRRRVSSARAAPSAGARLWQ